MTYESAIPNKSKIFDLSDKSVALIIKKLSINIKQRFVVVAVEPRNYQQFEEQYKF